MMKKWTICSYTAGLILTTTSLFAQNNTFPVTGNAGIGTTNPSTTLDVNGHLNVGGVFSNPESFNKSISIHGQNHSILRIEGGAVRAGFWSDQTFATPKVRIGSYSNDAFGLFTNGYDNIRLYVSETGNVGIGTTNPSTTLDVNGHLNVGGVFSNPEGFNKSISIHGQNHSILRIEGGAVRAGFWSDQTFATPKVRIGSYSNDAFGLFTNGYDNIRLYVSETGNVGIGTTTPGEKLAVNGNIRAKEIKVEAANWPDYVFEPDYKITSLADLDRYIKANKHLPELPAAAEVEKDGMAVGEMNKMLLKKVEELTLHLIEQQKLIELQSKRLDEFQKELQHNPKDSKF